MSKSPTHEPTRPIHVVILFTEAGGNVVYRGTDAKKAAEEVQAYKKVVFEGLAVEHLECRMLERYGPLDPNTEDGVFNGKHATPNP